MTGVLRRTRKFYVKIQTHREDMHVKMEADWSYAAMSQGTPMAIRNWKRQGRNCPWKLWKKHGPANTLILDF